MSGLTQQQKKVLEFYRDHHRRTGLWPTFAEVVTGLGFKSSQAVTGHVDRLVTKGYMARGEKCKSRQIVALPKVGERRCPECGQLSVEITQANRRLHRALPVTTTQHPATRGEGE